MDDGNPGEGPPAQAEIVAPISLVLKAQEAMGKDGWTVESPVDGQDYILARRRSRRGRKWDSLGRWLPSGEFHLTDLGDATGFPSGAAKYQPKDVLCWASPEDATGSDSLRERVEKAKASRRTVAKKARAGDEAEPLPIPREAVPVADLPELLQQLIYTGTNHLGVTPRHFIGAILMVIASVSQGAFKVESFRGCWHALAFYLVTIGVPASKKSRADKIITQVLWAVQERLSSRHKEQLERHAAQIQKMKDDGADKDDIRAAMAAAPREPIFVLKSMTPAGMEEAWQQLGRSAIILDEASSLLAAFNREAYQPLRTLLLGAFDGAPVSTVLKRQQDGSGGSRFIKYGFASLSGTIQPEVLAAFFLALTADGSSTRFGWITIDTPSARYQDDPPPLDPAIMADWREMILALAKVPSGRDPETGEWIEPQGLRMSDAARAKFVECVNSFAPLLESYQGCVRGAIDRLRDTILARIAAYFYLVEYWQRHRTFEGAASGLISPDQVERASKLVGFLIGDSLDVHNRFAPQSTHATPTAEPDVLTVQDLLGQAIGGKISVRELMRGGLREHFPTAEATCEIIESMLGDSGKWSFWGDRKKCFHLPDESAPAPFPAKLQDSSDNCVSPHETGIQSVAGDSQDSSATPETIPASDGICPESTGIVHSQAGDSLSASNKAPNASVATVRGFSGGEENLPADPTRIPGEAAASPSQPEPPAAAPIRTLSPAERQALKDATRAATQAAIDAAAAKSAPASPKPTKSALSAPRGFGFTQEGGAS